MWWYNRLNLRIASSEDENLAIMDAERILRRRLYYQGKLNPTEEEIKSLVDQVIANLKNNYGNIRNLRRISPSESLDPLIEKAVIEILP